MLASLNEDRYRAVDAINDFTRMLLQEQGFARRILPPLPSLVKEPEECFSTKSSMNMAVPLFTLQN
jgi:hypothetical protein